MDGEDGQVPSNKDRSRTYFTPTMERYFVDLMLEHMQKGNRDGHTFNKQAWNDMLAVFNAKFGSPYDKDVLKGHYATLWKKYNDVKSILGQGGFSWDEARSMVVADKNIWDSYLEAHPDAWRYKTKEVQNFSDLCLIYGHTTADGRYSRSSHDMDIDNEVNGVSVGDRLGRPSPPNTERLTTEWTLAMDQFFIELLLGQLEKGNKLDDYNSTTRAVWAEMLNLFNLKFGPHHTKRVLRHCYKKLFKCYIDIMGLLKRDDFSWDAKEQKAHPHARLYREKSMPNYKDLESIFGTIIEGSGISDLDMNLDEELAGSKTGSERSRTHWTLPMDSYLIHLMLDQVHRVNRIGQSFVTQAWIDMVASFNAKFSSNYDRDIVKNRYKHFKRLYNDISTLLGETGFSWDNAREMVVAEDHIWNDYIKAHRDARCYRAKAVPNYHKLCTVFCLSTSEGRYRHLAHKASVPSIGEGNNSWLSSEAKENSNWTPQMDECFIQLLLEQHRWNKFVHSFDDPIWPVITSSFNARCKLHYDDQALQDRYSFFMKQFSDVEYVLNQSGFSWNDTHQMVVANEEAWDAYSKEHAFTTFKGVVLRHHKDLSLIFGGFCSEKLVTKTVMPMGIDTVANSQIPLKETEGLNKRKRVKKSPLTLRRRGRVRRNQSDYIKEVFTNMTSLVSKLLTAKIDNNVIAIGKAIDALKAIPDIDDDLLLDACDILEDEEKAKTFLALDASLRKKWLLRNLGR
uniref:uncharacterized protein LOC122598980 isoform X2 n=1 Tax=Erigeron canadensis TaxID=72917 RepID=UPI001CB9058B|nr:uncharacterized protein LOC122598980 isoform X2 [Erigeron canadensis]